MGSETWLWALTILLCLGMGTHRLRPMAGQGRAVGRLALLWWRWSRGWQLWGLTWGYWALGRVEGGLGGWNEVWLGQAERAVPQLYTPKTSTLSVPLARGGEINTEKLLQWSWQVLQATAYSSFSVYTVSPPLYTIQGFSTPLFSPWWHTASSQMQLQDHNWNKINFIMFKDARKITQFRSCR